MKKILVLLGILAITSTTTPTIKNFTILSTKIEKNINFSQINNELKKEYEVSIDGKKQEKDDWCAIAVLQAIYKSLTKKEIQQKD